MIKVKSNNTNGSIAATSQVTPIIPSGAYENPSMNGLPEVHDPGHPYDNPAKNGLPSATHDGAYPMHNAVGQQPNVQVVPPPAYPQQTMQLNPDAAAVNKAKTFIEETFRGAVLMEAHSVSGHGD